MITVGTMRTILALGLVLCAACGDSGITPEPKEPTAGSTANGGAPGDGGGPVGGGAPDGGNGMGGSAPGGGFESGSRLKSRTRVGADGSRLPFGWHDTETNAACQWRKAIDGTDRCLPEGLTANRYSDDACTELIAVRSTCEPLAFALVSESVDECGSRWRVFPVGPQISPVSAWQLSNGNCVTASVPQGELHSVGPEMPATSFVGSTIEVDP